MKKLLIFILLLPYLSLISQQPERFCDTYPGDNPIGTLNLTGGGNNNNSSVTGGPYFLRIFAHVIRDENLMGGLTTEEVRESIDFLNQDFKEHNIFFVWDCDIIYENDDDHFEFNVTNSPITEPEIFSFNPHDKGIDIYFYPKQNSDGDDGQGRANGTPSTAFYIFGSYDGDPDIPLALNHSVSHEMGHCLGLWHTHHQDENFPGFPACEEFVDMSNCVDCGDFVCDTKSSPDLYPIFYPDCEWTGSEVDSHGDLYDPDETNIMSYTHPYCMQEFTVGQGDRMRQIINLSDALQLCLVEGDFINHEVSTTETWTSLNTPNFGDFLIEETLVIKTGATLTIQSDVTVHFGDEGRLVIEPGARLNLHGVLTGRGCGLSWKGVEVWGNSANDIPQSFSSHGLLVSLDGSVIENARTAAKLYGPSYISNAGGMFLSHRNTIRNCAVGLEFAPYHQEEPENYISYLSRANFVVDDYYPHDAPPFSAFVEMVGVKGITFNGCDFSNNMNIKGDDIVDWGHGILATDSGFDVREITNSSPSNPFTSSTFNNLGYGIYTERAVLNQPYIVRQSDFNNCFVGIRNQSVNGGTILYNDFNLGELPSDEVAQQQTGIVFKSNVNGFTCQENTITNTSNDSPFDKIGIFCDATGITNKTIRKNTFDNLTIGNLANATNGETSLLDGARGVNYLCNENYNVSSMGADINVGSGIIRPKQGFPIINSTNHDAAGNRFSNINTDFKYTGSEGIEYFYYDIGINENPIVDGNIIETPAIENPCPIEFCEPPCKTKQELEQMMLAYNGNASLLENAQADYIATPTDAKLTEISYYRQIIDEALYTIVLHQMYDTLEYDRETLLTWVGKFDNVSAELWIAAELMANNNLVAANQTLDNIQLDYNLTTEQEDNIMDYKQMINAIGNQSIYNLNKTTLDIIRDQAEVKNSAGGWAQNIMTLYGAHYPVEYLYSLGGDNINKSESGIGINKPDAKTDYITVYPNPATDFVSFKLELPEESSNGKLTIRDINGKTMYQVKTVTEFETIEWNTTAVSSGIYYYELLANENLLKAGKVIILK